jgi:fluoride ion exporter CrcB/FEX
MHLHHINLLAVLVAAIATMVVGFLWYSPLLFAKPWMREMGYDPNDKAKMEEMKKSAGPAYGGSFLASLVSAFILALFLHWVRAESLHSGLMVGFHVWLGFVATVQFTSALFTKQSMKLLSINTCYQLVCYLAMAAILACWN